VLVRRLEQQSDARDALRWGFAYGFVTQGAVLYWLVVALWHFTPMSALGYLATIAIFGLWHGLLFWFVLRVRRRFPSVPFALVFPIAWTAVEWAVGHQGDIRFPWLGTVLAAWGYGAWRIRTLPLRELGTVGLVQPNEGFREKWDPGHADSVVAKLVDLSRRLESGGRLDLLLWPEAAVPGWLAETPTWDAQLAALARESHTPILTGGLHAV